jgi:hypothetical protein
MVTLKRKTINGFEKVQGRIIDGYGVYKDINKRYYCIILEGTNKGITLCDCSKLKLIKEFISKLNNIISAEDINSNNFQSDTKHKIAKLRNEYWIL